MSLLLARIGKYSLGAEGESVAVAPAELLDDIALPVDFLDVAEGVVAAGDPDVGVLDPSEPFEADVAEGFTEDRLNEVDEPERRKRKGGARPGNRPRAAIVQKIISDAQVLVEVPVPRALVEVPVPRVVKKQKQFKPAQLPQEFNPYTAPFKRAKARNDDALALLLLFS